MSLLDIITIILFVIGILFTGLAFAKKGKNMKSFFAAGGSVPWPISGLSLFMGFFSAGTFVVWGSIAYSLGWVSVTIQWTMAIAGFIVGLFIAPRWNKTGALTAAEYITKRFGQNAQKTYTYLFLFISIFTTGAFLYPVAKIVEVSTGLPLSAGVLLLGGSCMLYVAAGGLWAVVVTDVLQFVILTAAVIILVPLALDRIDGISGFIQSSPDTFSHFFNEEYTLAFIIAFGIYNAISLGGNWAYVQRYTSVKSSKDAAKTGFLFGGLYLICPVLWMLPPMIYKLINPGLSGLESEGAYLMICKEALPAGLLGMMLGGMIFATASSINSVLNISSGVVTNDIFKRLYPESSDKTLMKVARFSTLGFGILAIIIALLVPLMGGIVNVVISIAALTGVPLYLPVIVALFSKRQTTTSVLTTTLLSLFVNALFKFLIPLFSDFSLNRTEEMVLGVCFPMLVLFVFELYYIINPKAAGKYSSCPIREKENASLEAENDDLENQLSDQDNKFSIRVIGIGIMITGLLISILGAIAGENQKLIIAVGVSLVILGFFIRKKG
jgi:SSS family transporter